MECHKKKTQNRNAYIDINCVAIATFQEINTERDREREGKKLWKNSQHVSILLTWCGNQMKPLADFCVLAHLSINFPPLNCALLLWLFGRWSLFAWPKIDTHTHLNLDLKKYTEINTFHYSWFDFYFEFIALEPFHPLLCAWRRSCNFFPYTFNIYIEHMNTQPTKKVHSCCNHVLAWYRFVLANWIKCMKKSTVRHTHTYEKLNAWLQQCVLCLNSFASIRNNVNNDMHRSKWKLPIFQ